MIIRLQWTFPSPIRSKSRPSNPSVGTAQQPFDLLVGHHVPVVQEAVGNDTLVGHLEVGHRQLVLVGIPAALAAG
jgi:hypothetical protein